MLSFQSSLLFRRRLILGKANSQKLCPEKKKEKLSCIHTVSSRGLDTIGRFSAVFGKGDNNNGFLLLFLYSDTLLKRGLLSYLRKKCSHREQILSFYSRTFYRIG